jgi:bleomycin hydrolase
MNRSNGWKSREANIMKKLICFLIFPGLVCAVLASVSCARREQASVSKKGATAALAADEAIYKSKKDKPEETELSMDFSSISRPSSVDEFKPLFHFPPVEQGNTGTCWSFAVTSLFESELKRLFGLEIKLSEMHTVYWEYVEKARRYVREHGNSALGQGSEPNAVILRMKEYGAVRESDYPGRPASAPSSTHDHEKLFEEFRSCLYGFRDRGEWDEAKAIAAVRAILDRHLGPPPQTITVEGKALAPRDYLDQVLRLPLDDYVAFISFKYIPFYSRGEYKVPDNWWHSQDYYNIPLEEFYGAIVGAVQKGYTLALAGDISEAGNSGENDIAVVPSFDLPRFLINQDSREFRFANRGSTDDHVLHVIGWLKRDDGEWFLLKDSWRTAFEGRFKGYFFYRDDYVKLKMLTFLVHKDAVADLLAKFGQEIR